jgi:hypothetical protein
VGKARCPPLFTICGFEGSVTRLRVLKSVEDIDSIGFGELQSKEMLTNFDIVIFHTA